MRIFFVLLISLLYTGSIIKSQWVECNLPFGGLVTNVTKSQDNFFISSEKNVFKSNSGDNWSRLSLPIKNEYCNLYVINSKIILDYGNLSKIYISNDNGDTWSRINLDSTIVWCYSPSFYVNHNDIFIFNREILSFSNDYGTTWNRVIYPKGYKNFIDFNIIDSLIVLTAYDSLNNVKVLFSSNYGQAWRNINISTSNDAIRYFNKSGNNYYLQSDPSTYYKTIDRGESWEEFKLDTLLVKEDLEQFDFHNFTVIDSTILFQVGYSVIMSNDEGKTWYRTSSRKNDSIMMSSVPVKLNEFYFAQFYSMEKKYTSLYRLKLGDSIWDELNVHSKATEDWYLNGIQGPWVVDSLLVVNSKDELLISKNKGDSWIKNQSGLLSYDFSCLNAVNDWILAFTSAGGILESNDNGMTWIKSHTEDSLGLVFQIEKIDSIYYYGTYDRLFKSSGIASKKELVGEYWGRTLTKSEGTMLVIGKYGVISYILPNSNTLMTIPDPIPENQRNRHPSMCFFQNKIYFLSQSMNLYVYDIKGSGGWQLVNNVSQSQDFFLPYGITCYNGNLTLYGSNVIKSKSQPCIYRSSDLGKTWKSVLMTKDNFPDSCNNFGTVHRIIKNNDMLIAQTTDGIYLSYNLGQDWFRSNENYLNSIKYDSRNKIVASNSTLFVNNSGTINKVEITKLAKGAIKTLELNYSKFCFGEVIELPYKIFGGINIDTSIISAELSDSLGNFENPTILTIVSKNVSSTLFAILPSNGVPSNKYRFRIIADSNILSMDNGSDITINSVPSLSLTGNIKVAENSEQIYNTDFIEGSLYLWEVVNGDASIKNKSKNIIVVQFGKPSTVTIKLTHLTKDGCTREQYFTIEVKSPTDINQTERKSFVVSPNPTGESNNITINFIDLSNIGYSIEIIDVLGTIRSHIDCFESTQSVSIPVNNLSKGLYYVRLRTKNSVYSEKLLIN